MKICIATHHFPPKYYAGAELYAYLLARHLIQLGNEVEVVTIESIEDGELEPRCETGEYDGITVHRLFFNHWLAERPFPLLYRNPYLGAWFGNYLRQFQPRLVHVNSGYLLGGTIIEEAKAQGIPTALTLHEYWFLCPINSLLRTDGNICGEPVHAAQCKWCMLSKKRRYRVVDRLFGGRIGEAFVQTASSPFMVEMNNQDEDIREINDRREYLQRVYQMVDLVISPSKFLIDKMEQYGFHHPNLVQLPYGLENIPEQPPQPLIDPSRLRLGYRGRISQEKGIDLLIRAVKMIPDERLSLHIYGDVSDADPYSRKLLKLAKGDSRIHFEGRYNNSQLPDILAGLDVSVVPSRWYENQPYTILESFAYGLPVIATDLGGMTEMIDHNVNGLLFKFDSADDLAHQLRRLLDEPDLLDCLRQGIRPVPRADARTQQVMQRYASLLGV